MSFRRLSYSRRRELLYDRSRGGAEFPTCNLCGLPITPGQLWDESHDPVPKAFGGTQTGLAHRRCNREHGNKVVTPAVAKAKRVRWRHIGAYRSRCPLPGGRNDPRRRKVSGEVVSRETGEPWR